jgi:hypothetical protein
MNGNLPLRVAAPPELGCGSSALTAGKMPIAQRHRRPRIMQRCLRGCLVSTFIPAWRAISPGTSSRHRTLCMISWQSRRVDTLMRRRLRKFLPIVLIALMVQIFAPIGATWAASTAASDALHTGQICSGSVASTTGETDQTGEHRAHEGCCSVCSVVHSGAPIDAPQTAVATPYRQSLRVVWLDSAPDLFGSRAGSHAQARAPPAIS